MKIKEFSEINPSPSCPIQGRHIINYIDTSSVIEGRLYDIQQLVKTFPSRAQREIRTQDILISSVRPNLKHNYFVEENANGMIASSGFIHIRVKDLIKISPRFLYYYLTSPSQVNRYIKIADSSQSAYPSFNKDIIEEIEFPNIDLPTQLRIAAIIFNTRSEGCWADIVRIAHCSSISVKRLSISSTVGIIPLTVFGANLDNSYSKLETGCFQFPDGIT